jgi:hypothetical protein
VTLVYQHELPNLPGKTIKRVLVEYGPGGRSPAHTHPKSKRLDATIVWLKAELATGERLLRWRPKRGQQALLPEL